MKTPSNTEVARLSQLSQKRAERQRATVPPALDRLKLRAVLAFYAVLFAACLVFAAWIVTGRAGV